LQLFSVPAGQSVLLLYYRGVYFCGLGRGRRRSAGTGLGLAIARQLVEAYAGEIRAESTPGAGTRFIITLPQSANRQAMNAVPPAGASIS